MTPETVQRFDQLFGAMPVLVGGAAPEHEVDLTEQHIGIKFDSDYPHTRLTVLALASRRRKGWVSSLGHTSRRTTQPLTWSQHDVQHSTHGWVQ